MFAGKQEILRQLIDVGKPYVWELRLSHEEFYELETAIGNSISSHTNDYHHLLCEEFAVIIVMYLAEWYKRFYKGGDTIDENKILSLTTEELKKIYQMAKIVLVPLSVFKRTNERICRNYVQYV